MIPKADLFLKDRIVKQVLEMNSAINSLNTSSDSLLNGAGGVALYQCYYAKVMNDDVAANRAASLIEDILDRFSNSESDLKSCLYSNGLSGFGSLIHILNNEAIIDFDLDSEFDQIDEFIFEQGRESVRRGFVEYLHGGAGILNYFNLRGRSQKIINYRSVLVDDILDQCKKDSLGIRIPRSAYIWNKNDDYDLSLSHGLCGVLLVLLDSACQRVATTTQVRLDEYLNISTNYIGKLARIPLDDQGKESYFPSYIPKSSTDKQIKRIKKWPRSRFAWCYGDGPMVIYLLKYHAYCNNTNLAILTKSLLENLSLRISAETTESISAHFCHGHAGIAHIFRKLYIYTGQSSFWNVYEYWLSQTVEKATTELKQNFYGLDNNTNSFIDGLPGISLVLLSYLSVEELNWDKLLLL